MGDAVIHPHQDTRDENRESGVPHVLVVDDDTRLRTLLKDYLERHDYAVTPVADAAEASHILTFIAFDMMVLDIMMPGENGLEFATRLRASSTSAGAMPILMLTAMGEPVERIQGLESGVDDYLVKPFEPLELLLRMNNILKRTMPVSAPIKGAIFGDYSFDMAERELFKNGTRVHLTEAERALLATMVAAGGSPVDREVLVHASHAVHGQSATGRAIDVQIARLRRKIKDDSRQPHYLLTVRGVGYRLRMDALTH